MMKRQSWLSLLRPLGVGLIAGSIAVAAGRWMAPARPTVATPAVAPAGGLADLAAALPTPTAGPVLNLSDAPLDPWAGVDASLKDALGRRIDFAVTKVSFRDALSAWGRRAGVNLSVNWTSLENGGFKLDAPVTLDLHNVRADQALRELLRPLGDSAGEPLAAVAEGNVVRVVNMSDLFDREGRRGVTRVYDVRALVVQRARWDRAFGGSAGEWELGDRLVEQVESSVANNAWEEQGFKLGRMHCWHGWLLVEHTPEVQAKVAALLAAMARGGPPVQIGGSFDEVPALWHGF